MHIYTHTPAYIYSHTYTHILYAYIYIQAHAYIRICIYTHIHIPAHLHIYIYTHLHIHIYIYIFTYPYTCIYIYAHTYTAHPTWGDTRERCYKDQSSKFERPFSPKRGKRDVRALSLEPSKMTPQVGPGVPNHINIWTHTHIYIFTGKCTHARIHT